MSLKKALDHQKLANQRRDTGGILSTVTALIHLLIFAGGMQSQNEAGTKTHNLCAMRLSVACPT